MIGRDDLSGVGINATELRATVHAWQEAEAKADEAYKKFGGAEIRFLLEAAGGFVTTSGGKGRNKGFCQTWEIWKDSPWPSTGVARVGEAVVLGKTAPYRPDVGDRIAAMDKEYRQLVFASQRLRDSIADRFASVAEKYALTKEAFPPVVRALVLEGIL